MIWKSPCKQRTQDGARTGKRNDGQRQSHKKNAGQAGSPRLIIHWISHTARQGDLKISEKWDRENNEYDKKKQVQPNIGGYVI